LKYITAFYPVNRKKEQKQMTQNKDMHDLIVVMTRQRDNALKVYNKIKEYDPILANELLETVKSINRDINKAYSDDRKARNRPVKFNRSYLSNFAKTLCGDR